MPGGLELLSPGACVVQTVDIGDECHIWDVTCNSENSNRFGINAAIFVM